MFNTIMYIVFGVAILVILLTTILIFSSKARGKMMKKNIEAVKYMMDESKDDIESISTNLADATKDGITTVTSAIKEGISGNKTQCKHCGNAIDQDSRFCKACGKEQ